MKRFRAAIYGGSGFAGAELVRRLLMHPNVELARVSSIDHVGEPLSAAHPHLEGVTDLVFEPFSAEASARDVDVVLLGLLGIGHSIAKIPGPDGSRPSRARRGPAD